MRKGMVRVHRVINLNAQVLRKWRDIARGPNGCRYLSMNIQDFFQKTTSFMARRVTRDPSKSCAFVRFCCEMLH